MRRYQFWLHDKDKKGRPIDENILKIAEEVAPSLTRYRQLEIDCQSTTNELLQSAVEASAQAMARRPIYNVPGYLTTIYKRFVDRFLSHEHKLVPVDATHLENLANADPALSFENLVHDRLLLEQLLNAMDPETRQICGWRLQGHSEADIAKRMGASVKAISARYTRGLKKAMKNVLEGNHGSKK